MSQASGSKEADCLGDDGEASACSSSSKPSSATPTTTTSSEEKSEGLRLFAKLTNGKSLTLSGVNAECSIAELKSIILSQMDSAKKTGSSSSLSPSSSLSSAIDSSSSTISTLSSSLATSSDSSSTYDLTIIFNGKICKNDEKLTTDLKMTDESRLIVSLVKRRRDSKKKKSKSGTIDSKSDLSSSTASADGSDSGTAADGGALEGMMSSMIDSSPSLQKMIEKNPSVSAVLRDPALMKQALKAAADPTYYNEMLKSNDRALANIEGMPGGMSALRRMYSQMESPMEDAMNEMFEKRFGKAKETKVCEDLDALRKKQGGKPKVEPMPNPSKPMGGPSSGGLMSAFGGTSAASASNPFASFGGYGGGGLPGFGAGFPFGSGAASAGFGRGGAPTSGGSSAPPLFPFVPPGSAAGGAPSAGTPGWWYGPPVPGAVPATGAPTGLSTGFTGVPTATTATAAAAASASTTTGPPPSTLMSDSTVAMDESTAAEKYCDELEELESMGFEVDRSVLIEALINADGNVFDAIDFIDAIVDVDKEPTDDDTVADAKK